MNARPIVFLMLALALVLAPLGICLNHGAAAAATPTGAFSMHHESSSATGAHAHHDGADDRSHFCAECAPPSFVKAGTAAAADIVPASVPAAVATAPVITVESRIVKARLIGSALPDFHPPPPRIYLVRLRV